MPDIPEDRQGSGVGRVGGGGRGWRHRNQYRATCSSERQRQQKEGQEPGIVLSPDPTRMQELAALKKQVENLVQILGGLKSRIQEIEQPGQGG